MTSAYLQWLCHSGERPVARGPLVEKRHTSDFGTFWGKIVIIPYRSEQTL